MTSTRHRGNSADFAKFSPLALVLVISIETGFVLNEGRDNYEDASEYLRQKMTRVNRQPKEIFAHFTIATDTNNINYVFDATMTIILQENLKEAGMF